jgi:hypothetical protein
VQILANADASVPLVRTKQDHKILEIYSNNLNQCTSGTLAPAEDEKAILEDVPPLSKT